MDWFPFYPIIYRLNTRHLTAEQDGIYRRLIDEYMSTRMPLPDDDLILSQIARVSQSCFENASSIIRAFFMPQKNGLLTHKFCEEILSAQDTRSRSRSEVAQKAAKKRWENNKQIQEDKCIEHTSSNANAMLENAIRQDSTREDKKESILTDRPVSISSLGAPIEKIVAPPPEKPKQEKRKQGARLPDGWALPDDWGDWAMAYCGRNGLGAAKPFVVEQGIVFKNYWRALPGQRAVKLDWKATWENWVRKGLPDHLLKIKRMEREKSYEQLRRGK